MTTIINRCTENARTRGDKTAFIMVADKGVEVSRLTYAALDRRARAVAVELQARCRPGERVLMAYAPGMAFIVGFMACQYANLTPVPVPVPTKMGEHRRRLEWVINDADVSLVMTSSDTADEIAAWLEASPFAHLECMASNAYESGNPAAWRQAHTSPDDLAFLQYTSGSTGMPRGAMISHRNVMHNCWLIGQKWHSSSDTIMGGWLPLFHDMGLVGSLLQTVYFGSTFVFMSPTTFIKRPSNWLRAISQYRINTSGGPNFAFEQCSTRIQDEEMAGIDLSSWRVCPSGAEPIRSGTLERFAQRFRQYGFAERAFCPGYGMAETTLMVTSTAAHEPYRTLWIDRHELSRSNVRKVHRDAVAAHPIVSCGGTIDLGLAIVDPHQHFRLAENTVGEIWVHGKSVGKGYWNGGKPCEVFGASIDNEPGKSYFRTGDLGFMHEDHLYVIGRRKDLITINGRNIYPEDIEHCIPAIAPQLRGAHSAVVASLGEEEECGGVAIVQELPRLAYSAMVLDDLTSAIREGIAARFDVHVADIVFVSPGRIPRTTSGKLQRHKVQMMLTSGALTRINAVPFTDEPTRQPQLAMA